MPLYTSYAKPRLKFLYVDINGFSEISGNVSYSIAGRIKEIDIGIEEFRAGAAGKEFNSSITRIDKLEKDEWHANCEVMLLELKSRPEHFKSVNFYDSNGNRLYIIKEPFSASGENETYVITIRGRFPEKGRIVVEVFENVKECTSPFKITNISILGDKLKE